MDKEYKIKIGKIIFQAAKIAVGSCGAISIAMALNLEYATTAGIITTAFNCTDEMGYTEAFDVSGHYFFVVGDCCVDLFPAYGQ